MRKKNFTRTLLAIIAITGIFLVYRAVAARPAGDSPCKESLDACSGKKEGGGKMIWENLSQQFFSSL